MSQELRKVIQLPASFLSRHLLLVHGKGPLTLSESFVAAHCEHYIGFSTNPSGSDVVFVQT